jgi:hypothetical protein
MTEIPTQAGTITPDPRAAHIRVHFTAAVQPWHCSLVAANSEATWWTENYADRDTARDAIIWLGRLFSPVGRATVYMPNGEPGYLEVWLDDDELGDKVHVPIQYVDERTQP